MVTLDLLCHLLPIVKTRAYEVIIMGQELLFPFKYVGPGRAILGGSFTTRGSNGLCDQRGNGFTVARTAAGKYTITFKNASNAIDAVLPNAHQETYAAPYIVNSSNFTPGPGALQAKTVDITIDDDAGTPSDMVAGTDEVHFEVIFRNTSTGT